MNKINYPKIEEYNKENSFYDYIENYIKQFKNKKDTVEISYLCAKEVIELTKENKKLYKKCVKCLELVKLWLKDENSINIEKLIEIANSICNSNYYSNDIICCVYSIIDSAYSIIHFFDNFVSYHIYSVYLAYYTKPELLPYVQNLTKIYLRQEKQFNTKEYNNTYHESILKQIINIEYDELQEIDKNQITDIINEYYDIEIDCFDFLTHKTIQKEFI